VSTAERTLLKMSELSERSGVPAATIKHYLREGVLGPDDDVVRTSRNMAYYPPHFVERIQLVRRLQDERYMPLKVIRELIANSPELSEKLVEIEDRILQRAAERDENARTSKKQARDTYDIPQTVLDRLEEIAVLSPSSRGYDANDLAIIEAISRFRAGGYEESLGFTVYDTLRYKDAFEPLVREEVETLVTRVAAQVDTERALQIIESADGPLQDLVGAIHSKMMLAELQRRRSERT
jgi:DNA-binding transcriptional MerR regulator